MWLFFPQLHVVYAQWTNVWSLNYWCGYWSVVSLLNCCVVIELTKTKTGHQLVNNLRLFVKWSRDISRDWLAQYLYFRMLKAVSSFLCSKFWFSVIIYTEVVANEPFSTDKPLDCSQSPIFSWDRWNIERLTINGGHLDFKCTEGVGVGIIALGGGGEKNRGTVITSPGNITAARVHGARCTSNASFSLVIRQ